MVLSVMSAVPEVLMSIDIIGVARLREAKLQAAIVSMEHEAQEAMLTSVPSGAQAAAPEPRPSDLRHPSLEA